MPSEQPKFQKQIALGVGVIALAVLLYFVFSVKKTFPSLSLGSYVGQIEGIADGAVTLYVERIPNANALLLVILSEDWRPQIVPLERDVESLGSSKDTEDVPFKPIVVSHQGRSFLLSGEGDLGTYRGEILEEDTKKGAWSLRSIARSEIEGEVSEAGLYAWLIAKAEELNLVDSFNSLEGALKGKEEKHGRLASYLNQEDLLKQRANERRTDLSSRLTEVETRHQQTVEEVSSLVSELNLLSRIKKRGKAVELARKVSSRENKWYFANWRAGEDTSRLEEFLMTKTNIDVGEFERERKQASEKRSLLREIEQEKRKMQQLQAREKLQGSSEALEVPGGDSKEKRNFWDRFWGDKRR